ncbi:patatin-like phospholipase family protein [Treponema sp.]|uniref:patatin-like phospholipase family protein n=1 Tax=Treponema sp. TaxID=166 RepID=UPI0025DA0146|nr:patatin-like phospholipase family protein [Treponema sp.]MCR5219352.1 patatin-like phospholipase family protein [Treponema sp.]
MKKSLILIFFCLFTVFSHGEDKKIGLCLSGGGAKGAYEAGVWLAMQQMHLDKNVTAVSGTSVGALNAALFTNVSPYQVKKLWKNEIGFESVLTPDFDKYADIISLILDYTRSLTALYNEYKDGLLTEDSPFLETLEKAGSDIATSIATYLKDYFDSGKAAKGLFSRSKLTDIIEESIDFESLAGNPVKIYVTCLKKHNLAKKIMNISIFGWQDYSETFILNEQTSQDNVTRLLLASSAMPAVFDTVHLDTSVIKYGKPLNSEGEYIDGGFENAGGQNIPVDPLLEDKNVETVIVVYLRSESSLGKSMVSKSNTKLKGKKLIEIVPSEPLGDIVHGTLNFNDSQIDNLILLGYKDARKVLKENSDLLY